MKTLLIMRHGEAVPNQGTDEKRVLTDFGQQQAQLVGQWLDEQLSPEGLLVSPYIRAQQTADAISHKVKPWQFKQTCRDITPDANPQFAADYLNVLLAENPNINSWLIVAHMPLVSYLVAQYCPAHMPLFNTASVAHIEYDERTQKAQFIGLYSLSEHGMQKG